MKWHAHIPKVTSDETSTGFTPAAEQELNAELQLQRVLLQTGVWHEVDNTWQAGLLPEGHVVRRMAYSALAMNVPQRWCFANAVGKVVYVAKY